MKTILDGGINCFSEIQLSNSEQVGLKFKRKVLDVLEQRHFLKQRRKVRAGQPLRRVSLPAAADGQKQNRFVDERASEFSQRERPAHVLSEPARRASDMDGERQLTSTTTNLRIPEKPAELSGETRRKLHDTTNGFSGHQFGQFQVDNGAFAKRPEFCDLPMGSQRPKVLPNNTQLEDLCKCHHDLLPKVTRATAKTVEVFNSCAPNWLWRRRRRDVREKSQPSCYAINKNAIQAKQDDEPEEGKRGGAERGREREEEAELEDEREEEQDDEAKAEKNVAHRTRSGPNVARITPNRARRKLKFQVPESISRLNTSLKPDDYDRALSILTSDVRYQLHLLLYGRLSTIWTLFSTILCILVPLLFQASLEPLAMVCLCLVWLALQMLGALVTRQFCAKLNQMLEKSVAQVNSYFMDHNLMLGVINVGGLFARARLVIPLLYFDTSQCRGQIESIISVDLRKQSGADEPGDKANKLEASRKWLETMSERKLALNYPKIGLHKIGPENQRSFAQSQLAKKIVLRYSQRWISFYDKQRLMFADDTIKPRHLSTGKCLCQFIEEHFKCADFVQSSEQPADELERAAAAAAPHHVIPMSDSKPDQRTESGATIVTIPDGVQLRELDVSVELAAEWRKSSPLNSSNQSDNHIPTDLSLQQQLDLLVPTLSQLVNLRERQEQLGKVHGGEQSNSCEFSSYASSKLLHSFASQLQHERLESNSSPTTEHSLDLTETSLESLGSGRNEELIKRLKLLLDSRKDEFSRGLDANAHAAAQLQQAAQSGGRPATIISDKSPSERMRRTRNQSGSTQTIDQQHDETATANSGSPISQIGKRFFSQTDGLFFLGNRKSQQGVYGKQQQQQRQILEIC